MVPDKCPVCGSIVEVSEDFVEQVGRTALPANKGVCSKGCGYVTWDPILSNEKHTWVSLDA